MRLKSIPLALLAGLSLAPQMGAQDDPWVAVARNAEQSAEAFQRCQRFVEGWLRHADPETGLIPRNLRGGRGYWNAQDCGADNYPFMVLTTFLTDRNQFAGRMRDILETEIRLTCRLDRLPDDYSFQSGGFRHSEMNLARLIFGGSEYVKDGLLPLTEYLGESPWARRMVGIVDDLWKHAPIETEGGNIPSTSPEINGEMMQALSRLYWFTGDARYLEYAIRIGDWYLLGERHPTRDASRLRLRDHGCELISGLSELYVLCHFARPARAAAYREPIHAMLDRILEIGCNEHGMMYVSVDPRSGKVLESHLSDTWGYNYNAFYAVYMIDGTERYREAVRHALSHLYEHYRGYPWHGPGALSDGYADSIESAINLFNREPIPAAARWIDSEIDAMFAIQRPDGVIEGWHGDGNFARTALMYALWKTQGVTIQPWRPDVRVGAVRAGDATRVLIRADWPWSGRVSFDRPRHRVQMHLPLDYPRINQFPEWTAVHPDRTYQLTRDGRPFASPTGQELASGVPLEVAAGEDVRLVLRPRVLELPSFGCGSAAIHVDLVVHNPGKEPLALSLGATPGRIRPATVELAPFGSARAELIVDAEVFTDWTQVRALTPDGAIVAEQVLRLFRGEGVIAFRDFDEETYRDRGYRWCGERSIALTLPARTGRDHTLRLLWGAKGGQRAATVTANGHEQVVVAGGYDGYEWQTVAIPAGRIRGAEVEVHIAPCPSRGKAAFIAELVLVANPD